MFDLNVLEKRDRGWRCRSGDECFWSVRLLGAVKQTGGCEEAGWGAGEGAGVVPLHVSRAATCFLFFTTKGTEMP